jgi:hypothetical protein
LPFGLAEVLAAHGKAEVEVITPHMFAAEDVFRTSEMPFLFPRLKEAGVRITAQHFIEKIDGDRLEVYDIWGGSPRTITGVDALVILWVEYRMTRCSTRSRIVSRKCTAWATCLRRAGLRRSSMRPRSWRARFDDDT